MQFVLEDFAAATRPGAPEFERLRVAESGAGLAWRKGHRHGSLHSILAFVRQNYDGSPSGVMQLLEEMFPDPQDRKALDQAEASLLRIRMFYLAHRAHEGDGRDAID